MMTQNLLIAHLQNRGVLHSPRLIDAFYAVDRKDFVRPEHHWEAYEDYPLPIGYGQTISQPYTVAFMLEALDIRPEHSVLDIGSGSGWTTALIATMAKEVIGLERIPELVKFAKHNLQGYDFPNATILEAGSELGIPSRSFDRILVSASASHLPEPLLSQLKTGGKLVIPVEDSILLITREADGSLTREAFHGFVFVPLIF